MSATQQTAGDDVVTAPGTDLVLHHELLQPSPTNPRKHFSPGPLEELSRSIEALGVETPLHVRPSKTEPGKYEIIAGERRWRAVELAMERVQDLDDAGVRIARLSQVPVRLRHWDDETVMAFQLIENLQREDLTPLEEADGYRRLLDMGHTAEEIATKINRSTNQVHRALKWARLPDLARLAFERGLMPKEIATLIARIPDELARRKATLELVFFPDEWFGGDFDLQQLERDARKTLEDEPEAIQPASISQARQVVRSDYMRSLREVGFDLDDAELMPVEMSETVPSERLRGGACSDCPYRTGCNPLFADELTSPEQQATGARGLAPDICTQPACLASKLQLAWERESEAAARAGVKVLAPEESAKAFRHGSKYVDLDAKPDYTLVGHANDGKTKTWDKLLKGVEVPLALARDDQGRTKRLVERSVAIEAVNQEAAKKGKESPFTAAAKAGDRPDAEATKEAQRKAQEEKKREDLARLLAVRAIYTTALTDGAGQEQWDAALSVMLGDMLTVEHLRILAAALEVEIPPMAKNDYEQRHLASTLLAHLEATGAAMREVQAVIMAAAATQGAWQGLRAPALMKMCGTFEVSLGEMKNEAKDAMKAKQKPAKEPKKMVSKGRDTDPDRTTELRNEEVAIAGILEQGDKERGLNGAACPPEFRPLEKGDGAYHCDGCGVVCRVPKPEIPRVEAMQDGEFLCHGCETDKEGFMPLPPADREEYETTPPRAES